MIIQLLFQEPLLFFAILIALVISITIHEFSHVLAARLLGDRTGEYAGRLTLNPLAHLDTWGTIAILLVGFGWGKPAPFNPYNLRTQRYGPALVALAGPFSNFLLIILFGLLLKLVLPIFAITNYLVIFLAVLVTFNCVLMIFNLIPLPPLDGSHILRAVLGSRFSHISDMLNRSGPMILLAFIFMSMIAGINVFGYVIQPVIRLVSNAFGVPLFF
ncbi:MAG: site-2 protease family protein [Patescibacteria group bacterium]|nr:site-2 protease family protein [Patescibacteria group bacterium]MDD5715381.1 site-2 protease family protein [Patescibacteria group bacterium]